MVLFSPGAPPVCGGSSSNASAFLAPRAPPPSSPGGVADAAGSEAHLVFIGIILQELSVTFIAIGANVQRYGLTRIDPLKLCFCGWK